MTRKLDLTRVLVLLLRFGVSVGSWKYQTQTLHGAPVAHLPPQLHVAPLYAFPPDPVHDPHQVPSANKVVYPFQLYLLPAYITPVTPNPPPLFQPQILFLQDTGTLPENGPYPGSYPKPFTPPETRPFLHIKPLPLQGRDKSLGIQPFPASVYPLPMPQSNKLPSQGPFLGPSPVPFPPVGYRPPLQPNQPTFHGKDNLPANRPFVGPYPNPFPPSESRPFRQPNLVPLQGTDKRPGVQPFPASTYPLPLPDTNKVPSQGPFRGPFPVPFPPVAYRPPLKPNPPTFHGKDNLPSNRPFVGPYPNPFPPPESRPFHQPDQRPEIRPSVNPSSFPTDPRPVLSAGQRPVFHSDVTDEYSEQTTQILREHRDASQPPVLLPIPETDFDTPSPLNVQTEHPLYPPAETSTDARFARNPPLATSGENSRVKDVGEGEETAQERSWADVPSSETESIEDEPRVLIDTWKTPSCPDGQKRDHAGRCRVVSL